VNLISEGSDGLSGGLPCKKNRFNRTTTAITPPDTNTTIRHFIKRSKMPRNTAARTAPTRELVAIIPHTVEYSYITHTNQEKETHTHTQREREKEKERERERERERKRERERERERNRERERERERESTSLRTQA